MMEVARRRLTNPGSRAYFDFDGGKNQPIESLQLEASSNMTLSSPTCFFMMEKIERKTMCGLK